MPVTLITGASSGFGAALAPLFAADGDTVVLTARRLENLEELAKKINDSGGKAVPIALDVDDPEAVKAAFAAVERAHGPVDRLIANAGISGATPAVGWTTAQLDRILRTNLYGVSHCIEAVLPSMLARKAGHLVAVSSLAGYRGLPGSGAYSASKAAVTNLMESLRIELRPHGVVCTTICPGFVRTPMTDKNTYAMPFMMELEPAARLMHRAIRRQRRHYAFPWQLAAFARLGRLLPARLYDWSLRNRRVTKTE